MEKRIYKSAPFSRFLIISSIVGGLSLLLLLAVWGGVIPLADKARSGALGILGVLTLSLAVMILLSVLDTKKYTVTVDSNGAEVAEKHGLGKARFESFLWRDVTEVKIVSIKLRGATHYHLKIFTEGWREILLTYHVPPDEMLKKLLIEVNQATKTQLGYIWEDCRENETRPMLETVPPFCKVAIADAAAAAASSASELS